jgi:parallel beta-helix repeat protein
MRMRLVPALLLVCLAAVSGPAVTADHLCGATIVDDLKLDHDLTCAGPGLIVGADGIRIDLNGHTIAGAGVDAGLELTGRTDVTIMGGTVRNFLVAIRINTSSDIAIKHSEFVDNGEGIDCQSGCSGNSIKQNLFLNSATRGIMLRGGSSDNEVKENTFTNNRVGILVFGGIDNSLKKNVVSGSSLAGIRFNVLATGNDVKENIIVSNLAGVEFIVTPTGSAVGNELKGNTIGLNQCGIKGPTAGNTLKHNSFEGNVSDSCS